MKWKEVAIKKRETALEGEENEEQEGRRQKGRGGRAVFGILVGLKLDSFPGNSTTKTKAFLGRGETRQQGKPSFIQTFRANILSQEIYCEGC